MAIIAGLVRVLDGPPVLFQQRRIGQDREEFVIFKFRTMVNDAESMPTGEGDTNRLTKTGRILRKSGLDELPQLFNVARGDMAIVGPRAVLPQVASSMPEEFRSRFVVLPGLTGLAQVSGRNSLPWSKRLQMDVRYVALRSWRLDIRIILRTVRVLLTGDGHVPDRNTKVVDDLGLLSTSHD